MNKVCHSGEKGRQGKGQDITAVFKNVKGYHKGNGEKIFSLAAEGRT